MCTGGFLKIYFSKIILLGQTKFKYASGPPAWSIFCPCSDHDSTQTDRQAATKYQKYVLTHTHNNVIKYA